MGVVPGKAAKLEKVVWNLKKTTFVTERLKTGIWWDQTVCIFWMPGVVLVTWAGSHFHSGPLKGDHAPFFTKKRSKSAKSNPIFHLKERRPTGLGLTDLDSPMAEFLSCFFSFSLISTIFRDWIGLKVGQNMQTLGISRFGQNSDFSKILQTRILYPLVLPLVKVSARSDHIWVS